MPDVGQRKFSDVVRVKQFAPVIELAWVDDPERSEQLTTDYIVTEELAKLFADILGSQFPGYEPVLSSIYKRRSHLITAQYGSGKTYFLLMLAGMLRAVDSEEPFAQLLSKFSGFPDVLRVLSQLKGRKYLVVHFSAKGQGHFPFKELLIKRLLEATQRVKEDIVLESEYTRAAEHLAGIAEKPVGKLFVAELDEQQEMTITQLREGLLDLRPNSLQAYRDIYKAVMGTEPSRVGLDMKKSLVSILQELHELGYTHVAVVIDELTQYLLSSIQHRPLADTLGELENFAQFCNDERNRYLFVAAMHRSLERIMREHGMDPEEQEDHRKMRERFDDHDIIFRNYDELLGRTFEIKEERFAELWDIPPVRKQLADWRQGVVEHLEDESAEPPISFYFPLHPATLRYLRGVTTRLGRETRTAFQFVADVVKPQLDKRPLLVNERLNVFTPDELFDYFLPDMDKADEIGLVVAYNTTQAKVGDDPLAMHVFKYLAMQYVNSTVMDLRAGAVTGMTIEQLADILNVSDLKLLDSAMEKLRAIRPQSIHYDSEERLYWFGLGGEGWDIDAAIANYMDTVKPNPNAVLRDVLKNESLRRISGKVVMNTPSSVTVIVKRTLEHEWRNTKGLREATEIPRSKKAEAKLIFVIPDFAEGYDGIPVELAEQAEKLSQKGICIILPRSTMMLSASDFRKLAALRHIAKSEEVTAHEQRLRIVNTRLQSVEEAVEDALGEFLEPSNYAYYVNRRQASVKRCEEAMVHLFDDLYPRFPRIKMESVSGRRLTNTVIRNFIANAPKTLPDSDQSWDSRFIREGMPAMGLVSMKPYAGGQIASLTIPDAAHSAYDIWREVLDSLGKQKQPIKSLYDTLMGSPYGLPDFLVEVYVSTYLALRKGAVIDLVTKRVETSPSAELAELITKEKDARFEVIPPGESVEALRNFIVSVWETAEKAVELRSHKDIDAKALDDQALWFNHIRPPLQMYVRRVLCSVQKALGELGLSYPYLDHFAQGLFEVATSTEDYIIPDSAYDRVFELCIELPPISGETGDPDDDPNIAFYRFKAINDACLNFLRDSESGKKQISDCIKAIGSIREVTGNIVSPAHERQVKDTAERFENCRENIFDKQARKAFVTSAHTFWDSYAEEHQTEHDITMQLRSAFGDDVLSSPVYSLLQHLSPLSVQFGLRTVNYFESQVNDVRAKAHDVGQRLEFPAITCPICGAFTAKGDSEKGAEALRQQSAALAKTLLAATQECLERLVTFDRDERFQRYLGEVEKPTTQQLWQQFVVVMQDSESALRENVQELLEIATELVSLVKRFQGYRPPPPPPVRVSVDQLTKSFTDFLHGQGIAEYSYSELRDKVNNWLMRVEKEKFARHD
jgi:hypothetical protein